MRFLFPLALYFISQGFSFSEPVQNTKDEIFPALPAAQDAVHWKDGYFYLDGHPTFISSGSIHYSRVPRELWRDRIWRLKQMGFNCVQSYVFWNASEPKEGVWDFTDNVDLDAWLTLLKEMDMYALVRVGPYSCAEWDGGGYPAWATIKPGIIPREMGQPFLEVSDPQVTKVEEITARHQLNHGGSVFLVQLENEHSRGWGTDVSDPYLKYLDDQARAHGIEVPMFNSGLHHSQDPSGEVPFPPDPSPWYSTEFWTGWIGKYGEMPPATIDEKVRGTWKIIAFGGAGYNYYMAHGGTNLGYSGDSLAASYDYSAPVGEAGQLHQFYFPARRAACFAQAFTPLLTASHNDPTLAHCDQPVLRVTSRTSPAGGSIVFIDHFKQKAGPGAIPALPPDAGAGAYHAPDADPNLVLNTRLTIGNLTLPHQGTLGVASSEPRTVIVNLPWTKNATFESICTNVLFNKTIGGTDYFVCYGPAGDKGEVTITYKVPGKSPAQNDFTYPADDTFKEVILDSGDGRRATLLVMNTAMSNRTWLAHDKLYVGPSFVLEDGSLQFPLAGGTATIYSSAGKSVVTQSATPSPALPELASWSWRDAAPERAPSVDATKWLSSTGPQPMETYDGFANRYGWYRTVLHRDSDGPVSLRFPARSGTLTAYLNGQPAPAGVMAGGRAELDLPNVKAGDNTLAILVKASPRSKNVSGLIGTRNARGLWSVSDSRAAVPLSISWKKAGKLPLNTDPADLAKPAYDDSTWSPVDPNSLSQPVKFARNNSWFRGTFTITSEQADSILELPVIKAVVSGVRHPELAKVICYINGQPVTEQIHDVSSILVPGKNSILLEVQSRLGMDSGLLTFSLWHNSPLAKATWYFHGGLDDLDETAVIGRVTNWDQFLSRQPWQSTQPALGQPSFWKCQFAYKSSAGASQTLGLLTDGLKAGHVWLNGHNLGESPQTVPMYVPECWLKDGTNDLVVFDLYGQKPDQVKFSRYEAFSVAAAK